jgi:hypothetical protein
VKLVVELILAVILHPIAVIFAWINLIVRQDMVASKKIVWSLVCLLWPIGVFLYILLGDGALW